MTDVSDLSTAVQARLQTRVLVQLTQWHDSTATTIDTTILTNACTDALGRFENRNLQYDGTKRGHVSLAIALVRYILHTYQGGAIPEDVQREYETALGELDYMRDRTAVKGGKAKGYAAYHNLANNESARFPNSVMDTVRKRPSNPNER